MIGNFILIGTKVFTKIKVSSSLYLVLVQLVFLQERKTNV